MKPLAARIVYGVAALVLLHLASGSLDAGKKKRLEDGTEVLNVPPEPPSSVVAETRRLLFHVSPLSSKGLLSQQTRDAIRAILRDSEGSQIVKIRAFVAGAGDLRRVPQIVSETFTERKHAQIPVVSAVQSGGLPLPGAQVVLESVAIARRQVNPEGLLFVSAREHGAPQAGQPLLPMAEKSLSDVGAELAGRAQAVSLTCFVTALDDAPGITAAMADRFPGAALNLVQTQRAASRSSAACEAVARVTAPGTRNAVGSERVVLTGLQTAYGFRDEDARLALTRLEKELSSHGASLQDAASVRAFALSSSIAAQINRLAPTAFGAPHAISSGTPGKRPFSTVFSTQVLEGLSGMDASFAVEAIVPAP